ncbi:hypothetical protein MNEG_0566 [Monoraphidium neglectum]|uniref:Uncharacterized protein n=1 Tax=Monoraphidium neglectum TaxID=145388 RepID=A0A0D2LLZ6_9CHLO|nr:hypothetical protein MNEG_0566 [Monoraphidium neglectum]KIZ07379.1 hypothetical protein MNEG_0566 [Monoraphidium neglectum]|eukprot:XP_013906398.1 hypothetical protein MNEG_0566 [Monoraphidium neglectum]
MEMNAIKQKERDLNASVRSFAVMEAMRAAKQPLTRHELFAALPVEEGVGRGGIRSTRHLKQVIDYMKHRGWVRPRPGAASGEPYVFILTEKGQAATLREMVENRQRKLAVTRVRVLLEDDR